MGILDAVKKRIYGSNNEHEEIRDHTRGDNYDEGNAYAEKFRQGNFSGQNQDPYENHRDQPITNLDDPEQIGVPANEQSNQYNQPNQYDQSNQQNVDQQNQFEQPISNQPERKELTLDDNRRYEIEDRLNIIETQLQAIRSQTETINERLKNLDAKLGRRF